MWMKTWRICMILLMLQLMWPVSTSHAAGAMSTSNELTTSTRFVDVAVGDNHTCALKANGSVMCWGYNGDGQLGINDSLLQPLSRRRRWPE
jgi:alpha-tubulin suppressor-like RCC1 family protein